MLANCQPREQYSTYRQPQVATPKNHGKGKTLMDKQRAVDVSARQKTPHEAEKTPAAASHLNYSSNTLHTRKKSINQQQSASKQRRATATKRKDSPISETASEKAVKDAMMKTTQQIFFPKAFKMPGSKKDTKKD